MKNIKYENLEKHFTAPKVLSPFYKDGIRIPRNLKPKVKDFCGGYWNGLDNGQRMWYYMEKVKPDFKRFLIKKMCEK